MIPLNDFKRQWAECGAAAVAAMERVGASGWYVLGKEVEAFERALAAAWGLPHAVGVANGLDAIEVGLRALDLRPGERVLTTPLSAFATTLAIHRAGGVPVFVDTDAAGLLDLDRAEAYLAAHADVRALVPVHLYGQVLDLDRLQALRERFGLRIVEDCVQSHGAAWRGRPCGSVGQVAATSFYPTKNLGALGDGGALLCSDPALGRRARALRDYGQSAKYVHDVVGLNSRLDELHAAVLRDALLPHLAAWTARRRAIAARYRAELAGVPGLRLVTTSPASAGVEHLFAVRVAAREAVQKSLAAVGVASAVHYPRVIPDQPACRALGAVEADPLREARAIAAEELSLPIHPHLTDDEVGRVIAAVRAALA
jgi:dTDP-4-amino-4,6-dideoxygalactose transaminase